MSETPNPNKSELDDDLPELSQGQRRIITTESIILGFLLGAVLIWWAFPWKDGHISHGPVHLSATVETLLVALYLTMVVAYCGFKMPTFFTRSNFWSTFALVVFAGHISLFFDSFAVILLLSTGIVFFPTQTPNNFNAFAVKAMAAFAALTVGGGFYLGELWGLPYYITAGLDNPNAGWPLLLVLTPYSIVLGLIAGAAFPVQIQAAPFDRKQAMAGAEFVVALLAIIITHNPFFCIGLVFLYSAISPLWYGMRGHKDTLDLVHRTAHELTDGGLNALGLIMLAVLIQQIPGMGEMITAKLHGLGLFVGAAISSPFAGAMVAPPASLEEFYWNLSLIMLGAPMFVFSSLVAIVVFTNQIRREELPSWMLIPARAIGFRGPYVPEAIAYTLLVIPMNIGLAVLIILANKMGWFVDLGVMLGMDEVLKAALEEAASKGAGVSAGH